MRREGRKEVETKGEEKSILIGEEGRDIEERAAGDIRG